MSVVQRFIDRQNIAYAAPTGTWVQRWLPFVCKHDAVRCTHGDEITARRFRRRVCMTCGRALRGSLPSVCWFTGKTHLSLLTGPGPEPTPEGEQR